MLLLFVCGCAYLPESNALNSYNPGAGMVASAPSYERSEKWRHDVKLWDVKSKRVIADAENQRGWGAAMAVDPKGRALAVAGNYEKESRLRRLLSLRTRFSEIRLWDLSLYMTGARNRSSLTCVRALDEHSDWIRAIAFSPDGSRMASGGEDGAIVVWNTSRPKEFAHWDAGQWGVTSLAYSADGRLLASGGGDCSVKLWDVAEGRCIGALNGHTLRWPMDLFEPQQYHDLRNCILALAFSPDGALLASGSDDETAMLWDMRTGRNVATLLAREGSRGVICISFSHDGRFLALGCRNSTVEIWSMKSLSRIAAYNGPGHLTFTVHFLPDGKLMGIGTTGRWLSVKHWSGFHDCDGQ